MTREEALDLMHEHTKSASLRQHMLAVEAAMRAYAQKHGEDPETWGVVGLLHDFDYEQFPNPEHSPTEGHPSWGVGLLREKGMPDALCRAILGHGTYTGVPRDTPLAKALFAVDELCGFLVACALVRPSRSFADLEVSSVKKKLKDKAFAKGVNRDEVRQGAEELGVPLDEHIAFVIQALRPVEGALGLDVASLLARAAAGRRRGARVSSPAYAAPLRAAAARSPQAARHRRRLGDDRRAVHRRRVGGGSGPRAPAVARYHGRRLRAGGRRAGRRLRPHLEPRRPGAPARRARVRSRPVRQLDRARGGGRAGPGPGVPGRAAARRER